MSNLSQIVKDLGFSENESKIYLALLELGNTNVSSIANKSGIKRTSCYVILEGLLHKGLVTKTQLKGKAQYLAEPPERLLQLIQERSEIIKSVLPEFKSLYNLSETKPKIRFYEGKKGCITICDDSLKRSTDEILLISNLDNLREIITTEYDENVYLKKIMADHVVYGIIIDSKPIAKMTRMMFELAWQTAK